MSHSPLKRPLVLWLCLSIPLALACGRGKDESTPVDDSQPTTDDTPKTDDSDSPSVDDTNYGGEQFERVDAAFTVSFGGETWTASEGYWLGSTTSFINATKSSGDRSYTVTIQVDGNIRYAGSYPITLIRYSEGPAQSNVDVNYEVSDPAGVKLVVDGYADTDYIVAHQEGTATVTPTVGGSGDLAWEDMKLESWPKY